MMLKNILESKKKIQMFLRNKKITKLIKLIFNILEDKLNLPRILNLLETDKSNQ